MALLHRSFFITSIVALMGIEACTPTQSAPLAHPNPVPQTTPTSIALYAAGDIADCQKRSPFESGAAQTARVIAAGLQANPAAIALTLGDTTYPVGLLAEFTDCYGPTWGRFKERTYPTPGNHEYYSPAAAGYFTYFGTAAGPEHRGYFGFQVGQWHIVSINSNLSPSAHQQQVAWLKTELTQHPARCTLAYWHHPLYSSGGHGNNTHMADIWQVLYDAHADVVLAAHDHDYERFAPQDAAGQLDPAHGLREFVVGTGGAKLTPFFLQKPNSEIRDNATHGVLRMQLNDASYTWEFLPASESRFTDRGQALCH